MIAFLLNLLLMGLLSYRLYRRWRSSALVLFYWPGLLLKVLCGWAYIAIYRYHYGYGDIFSYHEKASALATLFWQKPADYLSQLSQIGFLSGVGSFYGWDRVDFFVKLISPIYVLSGSNSWIAAAWLSILSFLGLFWLSHRLSSCFSGSALAAAVAFLFWPSVQFWTGSITKEALVMPAISILVACLLPFIIGKGRSTLLQWLLALIAAWIIWRIKYYFALPLFAMLIALMLVKMGEKWQIPRLWLFLLLAVGGLAAGLLLSQLHPNLYPERVLGVLTDQYREKALLGEAYQRLQFRDLQPTVWSMLYHMPKALAGGLLMPLPLLPPRMELLPLLASVENVMVLLLLIGAFYKLYRLPYTSASLPALGLVFYVCFLAVAMAMASPNFGTLLRYRTAYLPFAIFLLLYWLFPAGWHRKV